MTALEPVQPTDRPPYSNRGVTIASLAADGPSFDAYFATVYAHPFLVLDRLEQALRNAGQAVKRDDGPPVRFYAQNALLLDARGHRLLSVRYGGQNIHPFVEAKGHLSAVVAATLREHFEHAPARLDSAYDLRGPTAFLDLVRIAQDFEAGRGLPLDHAGATIANPDRGTTLYLASRKSQAFVRIYQKGLQIAEEMGLTGPDIPDELRYWVRVELEYKPDKRPARMKAVELSPAALWGCSPWTRDFAKVALSIDAERVKMTERRESNHERAMRYLVQQYGATILRQVELLGSWERFIEDLQERLAVDQEDAA